MRSYSDSLSAPRWSRKAQFIQRIRKIRNRKTGLILTSDTPLKSALPAMLKDLALNVVTAQNQDEFFKAMEKDRPDVAFVDAAAPLDWKNLIGLPSTDQGLAPSIIACVGRGQDKIVIQALQNGADDYLVMPFDFPLLRSKLACLGLCSLS